MFVNNTLKEFKVLFKDFKSVLFAMIMPPIIVLLYSQLDVPSNTGQMSPISFICCFAVVFSSLNVSTLSIVQERVRGTLKRFEKTPGFVSEFVLSKYLAQISLSFIQSTALFVSLVVFLNTEVSYSDISILPVLFLLGMSTISLGLVISSLASNEVQSAQVSTIILLAMVVLSGFFKPIEDMGDIGKFSKVLPFTQGYQMISSHFRDETPEKIYWVLSLIDAIVLAFIAIFIIKSTKRE